MRAKKIEVIMSVEMSKQHTPSDTQSDDERRRLLEYGSGAASGAIMTREELLASEVQARIMPSLPTAEGLSLVARESALSDYIIEEVLLDRPPTAETLPLHMARRVLQVAPVCFTLWGSYYYIPVNMQAGHGSTALGVLLNVGNTLSCVFLNTWSTWKILDKELKPLSQSETTLLRSQFTTCERVSMFSGSIVIGALAQFAIADIASIYNNNEILPGIALILSDGPVPIYSSLLSMEKIVSRSRRTTFEQRLTLLQERAVTKIQSRHTDFLKSSRVEQLELVRKLLTLKEEISETDGAAMRSHEVIRNEFFKILTETPPEGSAPASGAGGSTDGAADSCACFPISQRAVYGLGLLLSAAHLGLFAKVAYDAGDKLGKVYVGASFATAIVGANAYLRVDSVSKTALSLFSDTADLVTGNYTPSMSEQLRPGLSLLLKAAGLVCTILSYGGSVGMAEEAFEEEAAQQTFGIAVSVAFTLFTFMAFNELSGEAVDALIKNTGDADEASLIEYDEMVKKFMNLIGEAPAREFATFLDSLPDEMYEKLAFTESFSDRQKEAFNDLLERYLSASASEDSTS